MVLGDDAHERVVEAAPVQHITRSSLELGAGLQDGSTQVCQASLASKKNWEAAAADQERALKEAGTRTRR
jgi:hypothetical protein